MTVNSLNSLKYVHCTESQQFLPDRFKERGVMFSSVGMYVHFFDSLCDLDGLMHLNMIRLGCGHNKNQNQNQNRLFLKKIKKNHKMIL